MKTNRLSTASAVVCAYNEEKNVAYILRQLIKSQLFTEIVAVDDGSTDRTPAILDAFGQKIKTIHLPENQGKSFAMVAGLQATTGQIIVFCDADLISIRKSHLLALLRPLQLDLAAKVIFPLSVILLVKEPTAAPTFFLSPKSFVPPAMALRPSLTTLFGINAPFGTWKTAWIKPVKAKIPTIMPAL